MMGILKMGMDVRVAVWSRTGLSVVRMSWHPIRGRFVRMLEAYS